MIPADRALAERYPELPGLQTLLEPDELTRVCAPWDADYEVERLRLKPGASVTAVMRPAAQAGPRPWLLARALAPHPWETKRQKDVRAAERAWRRVTDAGGDGDAPAVVEFSDRRMLVSAAIGDRRLRGLRSMLPDTGVPVRLGAVARRDHLDERLEGLAERLGGRDRLGVVRTLSHNPARRFVGHWMPPGCGPGWLVRVHADRPRQVAEFVAGRHWAHGDPVPRITDLAAARAEADALAGRAWQRADVGGALRAAAVGMTALDTTGLDWSARAAQLASELATRLAGSPVQAAHGDLSPDQLVVTDTAQVCVLDWDRAGLWPAGWDAATWVVTTALGRALDRALGTCPRTLLDTGALAGLVDASEQPVPGGEPPPDVVAAAALLRAPEPFRRRYPEWPDLTELLIRLAERCLGAQS